MTKPFETLTKLACKIYALPKPQHAGFLAWLCDCGGPPSILGLVLCCCPRHLMEQKSKNVSSSYIVRRQGEGNSQEPLCKGDKIYVNLISLPPGPGSLSEEEIKSYHLE